MYSKYKGNEDYDSLDFMPRFLDEAPTEKVQSAIAFCGSLDNIECVFDQVFMDNTQISQATKEEEISSTDDINEIGKLRAKQNYVYQY